MTTYPADPQASEGLRKCINMLERMHYIWPSAWRANELLQGSKAASLSPTMPSAPTPERHKRTAESMDDDSHSAGRPVSEAVFGQQQGPSQPYAGPSSGVAQPAFPLELSLSPTADQPAFYPPYSRWTPDSQVPSIPGNLSTSALPQTYSTGLVDDRHQRNHDRPSRYPQYWNDYSALGQMDSTYGMPVLNDMVPQQPAAHGQVDPQMYAQDQYTLFSKFSPR